MPQLERKVESATEAVGELAAHAAAMGPMVPKGDVRADVAQSTGSAMEAVAGLAEHAEKVRETIYSEKAPKPAVDAHEREISIVVSDIEDAEFDSADLFYWARDTVPGAAQMPEYSVYMTDPHPEFTQFTKEAINIAVGLIDDAELRERFLANPPVVTFENEAFFSLYLQATAAPVAVGIYLVDSNHMIMRSEYFEHRTDAEVIEGMVHEMVHYASFLGGGMDIRRKVEPVGVTEATVWFIEGLTELTSQLAARESGRVPENVPYSYEVIACNYIMMALGKDGRGMLEDACLSGDYGTIADALDKELGRGTFDGFMEMQNGAEAVAYLEKIVQEAGIDSSSWMDSPVMLGARRRIEEGPPKW
jgi:hypothetical protein